MPSVIQRHPITERVLSELEELSFPVGDNDNPDTAYGWNGEPNETGKTFTPWMIVTALTGSPQKTQAMGDTGREWLLPYSVFYAGVSRAQAERLADRMRQKLVNIERESVATESGNWRIQKVSFTGVGNSAKVTSAFPDYYTQTDTFEVWVSKERS